MKAIFKQFKSIEEIKAKGEFIKKGKIYPSRIIKCSKRKFQHRAKSGSNQWAFPTKRGYLIFVESNDGQFDSAIKIKTTPRYNAKNGWFHSEPNKRAKSPVELSWQGSPYSEGGTLWKGNHKLGKAESLEKFNKLYLEMNGDQLE